MITKKALINTNKAYIDEDYDKYEHLIEYYANKFGVSENLFEDWVTEYRMVEM